MPNWAVQSSNLLRKSRGQSWTFCLLPQCPHHLRAHLSLPFIHSGALLPLGLQWQVFASHKILCVNSWDTMSSRLVVEYAKSARAACKHCGKPIEKGSVRLGSISKADAGFDVTRWNHPSCFAENNADGSELFFEKLSGFTLLKVVDQTALKKLLDVPVVKLETDRMAKRAKIIGEESDRAVVIESSSGDPWEKALNTFSLSQLSRKYKTKSPRRSLPDVPSLCRVFLHSFHDLRQVSFTQTLFAAPSFSQDAILPQGWKAFSTVILGESDGLQSREKIAAFDFDGCLVKTSVHRHGPDAWSLFHPSVPAKLQGYYHEGYKLVIFSNESNIDRWKNSRQKAVDSKLGRLIGLMKLVQVPMQVFIACAKEGTGDPCRKPKPGMWTLMEHHFNEGLHINKERSFYVGDAAGRPNDHSNADINFAQEIGLKFMLPEDVFVPASS